MVLRLWKYLENKMNNNLFIIDSVVESYTDPFNIQTVWSGY